MKVLIAFGCLVFSSLVFLPSPLEAEVVEHAITGTLSDGSEIFGTFGVDSDSLDVDSEFSARGYFDLVDVNVSLVGTVSLFTSGGSTSTSGVANSGSLFQANGEQSLLLNFVSDNDDSGAFTYIPFGPFSGDVNVAAPIQSDYLGQGYVDGNGMVDIVSLSISIQSVPEPTGGASLMLVLSIGFLRRRRRQILGPLNVRVFR